MTQLLAGDVGGTKTILRLVRAEPAAAAGAREAAPRNAGPPPALTILGEERYRSADDPDLAPIAQRFLAAAGDGTPPAAACFGVAGPVADDACEVTNLGWSLSGSRLERELGIPEVRLINDFEAICHGVLGLGADDLHTLQPGRPDPAAPIAVLGAGTGLGEAFLIPGAAGPRKAGPRNGGPRAFATEGGHADFAPQSELEFQHLRYLREAMGLRHVSVERVVSGPGITWIYDFLRGREPALETPPMAALYATWKRELGDPRKTVDLAAEISRSAIAGDDSLSEQTMKLFVAAYGTEAGNLALKLLPYGGLYVAGGIAAKNLPLLEGGGFLAAFLDKGRMRSHLERVPVHVVLDPRVGLVGAALYAARLLR